MEAEIGILLAGTILPPKENPLITDQNSRIDKYMNTISFSSYNRSQKNNTSQGIIAGLRGPVLGFIDVTHDSIDCDLILSIAIMRPEWSILIVGQTSHINSLDFQRFSNVHLVSECDKDNIAAYISLCDVRILPYASDVSNNEYGLIKLLESLPAETSASSTQSETESAPKLHIMHRASSHEELISLCADLIDESDNAAYSRGMKKSGKKALNTVILELEQPVLRCA